MKKLLLCIFILSNLLIEANNKIIYLISPPRSLSVGFLRMMETRGDCAIFHEPSQLPYALKHFPDYAAQCYIINESALSSFDVAKSTIFSAQSKQHVFVKEMSFASIEFLIDDLELIQNSDVYFVFLVRHPHGTIASFIRKELDLEMEEAAVTTDRLDLLSLLVGYESCYKLFKRVQEVASNKPLLIRSEDLGSNPKQAIQGFCEHVGIPYKSEALHWKDLGDSFAGSIWHDQKYPHIVHLWHGDAIHSTHFMPLTEYHKNELGMPTFQEFEDPEVRAICSALYARNLLYYDLLVNMYKI